MAECSVPFLGNCDLDLLSHFKNNLVWSISPTLFGVGIQTLVCGWMHLGIVICRVPFNVTVTLLTLSEFL